MANNLKELIEKKEATISIIGLGYVGLPLLIRLFEVGFKVIGFDNNSDKIRLLKSGKSYINDIEDDKIKELYMSGKINFTDDFTHLRKANCHIVCVPTPLKNDRITPFLDYLNIAISNLEQYAFSDKTEKLIIFESTVYPGFTDDVCSNRFKNIGEYKIGENLYIGFSPERVDPTNKFFNIKNTPKLVSGFNDKSLELVHMLYSFIVDLVVDCPSTKVAETAKLLENIYRYVNISLINEMKIFCDNMKIDIWEVIKSASTKPFGFNPFYPGPGIGGHCIPDDPFYLKWILNKNKLDTLLIDSCRKIEEKNFEFIMKKIKSKFSILKSKRIFILGMSFKKDINDSRNSPSIDLYRQLKRESAYVFYNDPYVKSINIDGEDVKSTPISSKFCNADCCILMVDHTDFNYEYIYKNSKCIFDSKNIFLDLDDSNKVIKI